MISAILLMMSQVGFSSNSKSEWVSLCENATGAKRHTCESIRKIAEVTPAAFSGNWKKTYNKLASFKKLRLNLENLNISDLSPLVQLSNLSELKLDNNQITDISSLAQLKNLKKLHLDNNRIVDFTALAELKNLTTLDISRNKISDLTPFSQLKELVKFHAAKNRIIDLKPLAELKNLTILDVSINKIKDIGPLSQLKKLKDLNVSKNKIKDIRPLSRLKRLKALNISRNKISDLSPLAGLEHLYWLDLEKNRVSDFSPVDHVAECVGCVDEEVHLSPRSRVEPVANNQGVGLTIKLNFDKSKEDGAAMFVAQKDAPFFSDPEGQLNFSRDSRLSQHMTEEEWRRLDQEFLTVWNSHRASQTPVWKKALAVWGGVGCFFCVLPLFYTYKVLKMDEQRNLAIAETVAKANKYVFAPRGMFMKLRIEFRHLTLKGNDALYTNDANMLLADECYYVAIGPDAIKSLKRQDIYDWDSFEAVADCMDRCCGFTKYNYNRDAEKFRNITAETIEEDREFKQRWR